MARKKIMCPIYLISLGHYAPKNIFKNEYYKTAPTFSDPKITEHLTGIKERRSVLDESSMDALRRGEKNLSELREEGRLMSMADLSEPAYQLALERLRANHGESALSDFTQELELIVCGSSVPDYDIPANANKIAERLGLSQCLALDINAACSSFGIDLHMAIPFLLMRRALKNLDGPKVSLAPRGRQEVSALILNPERYTLRMDYHEKRSSILFGDGATAALLSTRPLEGSFEVLKTIASSDSSAADAITIQEGGTFIQDGPRVKALASAKMGELAEQLKVAAEQDFLRQTRRLKKQAPLAEPTIYFAPHQANLSIMRESAKIAGIAQERMLSNIETMANQGAAGAPSVVSGAWDRLKKGDYLIVATVGSGMSWAGALLKKT